MTRSPLTVAVRISARGERHGSRVKPESVPRGERHGSRTRPERLPRGERHGNAKLSESSVREMRAAYAVGGVTCADLAMRFGVHKAVAWSAVTGRSWRHVT